MYTAQSNTVGWGGGGGRNADCPSFSIQHIQEGPNQPETAANALAHRTKIQFINTQQATAVQSSHQTHMDLRHTKPSNSQIIQRVQSKILRMICDAPRYVSNKTLHESSATPLVEDKIHRLTHYLCKLSGHANQLVHQLHTPPGTRRRLRRQWPTNSLP